MTNLYIYYNINIFVSVLDLIKIKSANNKFKSTNKQ